MTLGLTLILLTGLTWGGIGVVSGLAARRHLNVLVFTTTASLLGTAAGWLFLVNWPDLVAGHVHRALPLVLIMSIAGMVGSVGMLSLQKAMTAGAAAWSVGQSALVIPFIVGILFLREPLGLAGVLGLLAILASLAAFAIGRKSAKGGSEGPASGWLGYAIVALLLLGTQQALMSIPSSWPGWSDTARLRVPISLATGAIPLLAVSARRGLWPDRAAWTLAPIYACLAIAGQLLLFPAMDHLRSEGRLSIAFPLALGTCIVLVAVFDVLVWKTPTNRLTMAGIVLCLVGIVLLAI